jgi:hypothetical protein
MQVAKSFDRGYVFREINARRQEINRNMIWDREMGKPTDPKKLSELSALAEREDALLEFGAGASLIRRAA